MTPITRDGNSICVYTSIMGGYEALNEQPEFVRNSADFICFSDTDLGPSNTWTVVPVKPEYPDDLARSQRSIKLLQNPKLKKYEFSIYIDNSVILSREANDIVDLHLGEEHDIAMCKHSFRTTVLDEFQAVSDLAYDEQSVILKQLETYAAHYANILQEQPFWGGMIIRRHGVEAVEAMMRTWFDQVLLHSRRDQLSVNFAIKKASPRLNCLELNNNSSPIHSWPHVRGRRKSISISHMVREIADAKAIANLVKDLGHSTGDSTRRLAPDEEYLRLPCRTLHLQAGSNHADAGGEVSFGIAEFPDYLPMATIGGSLENAGSGESQGGISFKTRPVGASGQDMVERARINANGTISLSPLREPAAGGGCTLYFDSVQGLLVSFNGVDWRRIETRPVGSSLGIGVDESDDTSAALDPLDAPAIDTDAKTRDDES
ncbi:UNVERIFIED_ORG: hypothetical protein J2W85_005856 [Ensifer adhaerens]|nr:hypothetical protein [Ensifer adhaerens]